MGMTEVKNLKTPSGCSAFGFWSFAHDGGSIYDIHNDDCGSDKSHDNRPAAESYIKSKLVAMLIEIRLELEKIEVEEANTEIRAGECCMKGACINLIQEKINSLKENIVSN